MRGQPGSADRNNSSDGCKSVLERQRSEKTPPLVRQVRGEAEGKLLRELLRHLSPDLRRVSDSGQVTQTSPAPEINRAAAGVIGVIYDADTDVNR